jgi:DNA-binding NtrC family response regulator
VLSSLLWQRAAAASEVLQMPKKTLYDKLKRLGLAANEFKLP